MKYTRKSILKRAGRAGLALVAPAMYFSLYNYLKYRPETLTKHSDDISSFRNQLEGYCFLNSDAYINPDVLILNADSRSEHDFVILSYNRDNFYAPIVLASIDDFITRDYMCEYKDHIKALEEFAQRHDIFVYYENRIKTWYEEQYKITGVKPFHGSLISRIKNCGKNNSITEDLFGPVSEVYAQMYIYTYYKSKGLAWKDV